VLCVDERSAAFSSRCCTRKVEMARYGPHQILAAPIEEHSRVGILRHRLYSNRGALLLQFQIELVDVWRLLRVCGVLG